MRNLVVATALAAALSGCAVAPSDIGREPHMSAVGSGLQANVDKFSAYSFPAPLRQSPQSLWDDSRANFFRDPRASRVGDVLTVSIAIDDKATLDNSSDRSSSSSVGNGFDFALGSGSSTKTAGQLDSTSTSKYNGSGTVDRSEKIQLSIAAVVSGVMPDGNLIVSGSQEIRVNYEMRLLNIAGIVRPRDISKDNTISYDKIAEARISYGGRGRSSEVQQPGWGQQIYDAIKPL
ncbi:flagellar basal body L-ring protein FlgH [Lichenihabitans sp. Uapishka_5]|uniref:flagellar basal body L-ring protein FlgH n=1 Tax=Lichenihabitans sp. Uapishka_5 TaxID=3037302 RepID=UPI0029E80609|nr:flagellar basal body L-ring protein FlgH [Lichenihabitans sp. Uapishka_5]MDX7952983.1 flagellar basal body L-ring protein FlgH [Lichenihabitans sp. Uapishka_5]